MSPCGPNADRKQAGLSVNRRTRIDVALSANHLEFRVGEKDGRDQKSTTTVLQEQGRRIKREDKEARDPDDAQGRGGTIGKRRKRRRGCLDLGGGIF